MRGRGVRREVFIWYLVRDWAKILVALPYGQYVDERFSACLGLFCDR